jgi:alpha-tubulin suppressor-like RCC1 family protein
VRCWGYNAYGQLGDNTTTSTVQPVHVSGLNSGMKTVKAGYSSTCALSASGKVKCWGYNAYGQLGDNTTTNRLTPVGVYNLDKANTLTVGYYHACVVTAKKAVKCWGYNGSGALGNNTTTNSSEPVRTAGF